MVPDTSRPPVPVAEPWFSHWKEVTIEVSLTGNDLTRQVDKLKPKT